MLAHVTLKYQCIFFFFFIITNVIQDNVIRKFGGDEKKKERIISVLFEHVGIARKGL